MNVDIFTWICDLFMTNRSSVQKYSKYRFFSSFNQKFKRAVVLIEVQPVVVICSCNSVRVKKPRREVFTFIFSSFRWVIPKELHLNTKRKQCLIKLRLYSLRNYMRMLFVMRTFFCEWWKHYDESFKTFKLINCFSDRWQVIVKLIKVKFPCINSWNPAKLFQKQVTWRTFR